MSRISKKFIKNFIKGGVFGIMSNDMLSNKGDFDSSEKTKFTWLGFATKSTEIMELVLFFGGVTLAILIICGILPFGALGIGICIACSFICASHFFYTNSWTCRHNYKYLQKQMGFSESK